MNRSGYSDEIDGWALIRWRGAVSLAGNKALGGESNTLMAENKRGQLDFSVLRQAISTLDEAWMRAREDAKHQPDTWWNTDRGGDHLMWMGKLAKASLLLRGIV